MLVLEICGMRLSDLDHAGSVKSGVRILGPLCGFVILQTPPELEDPSRHLGWLLYRLYRICLMLLPVIDDLDQH